ncbi:hypothetical protein [uncultured Clostridium sp.]|uniref:hypothetical protein n=1 Tax=uncultured Clostridium sp. TaxID=59620 RepID=UPI0026F37FD7|nr:hypothetical protein [uncultured Clostridium sp.]
MKLKELKDLGAIPSTVRQMNLKKLKNTKMLVEFDKARNLAPSDRKKFVVLKNPTWVAADEDSQVIYSYSESSNTYSKYKKGITFLTYEFDENSKTLCLIGSNELNNKSIIIENQEERPKMENNNKDITNNEDLSLEDLIKDLDSDNTEMAGLEIPAEMDTFSDNTATEEAVKTEEDKALEAEKKLIGGLKSSLDIDRDKLAPLKKLGDFNRLYGGLYGFVVNTEPAIKVSKVKVFATDENKKLIVSDNAPDDIKKKWATGLLDKLETKYKKYTAHVRVKQAGPSAMKGGVLGIPLGGFLPMNAVLEGNFEVDEKQQDLRKILLNKDELIYFMETHFEGRAYDKTREKPTLIKVVNRLDRKAAQQNTPNKIKSFLVPEEKGVKLYTESNFLPLTVYEKIDVSKALTAEEAKDANLSAFALLFRLDKNNFLPYNDLGASYKDKISYTMNDGVVEVTSEYFQEGKPAQWDETPKSWIDNQSPLHHVLLPKRRINNNKEKNKVTYPWISYSATSTDALKGDQAYLAKTSLQLPEYAKVREYMGNCISPQSLAQIKGRGGKSAKQSKGIDTNLTHAQAFGYLAKMYNSELDSKVFETAKAPITSDSLTRRFEEARFEGAR